MKSSQNFITKHFCCVFLKALKSYYDSNQNRNFLEGDKKDATFVKNSRWTMQEKSNCYL